MGNSVHLKIVSLATYPDTLPVHGITIAKSHGCPGTKCQRRLIFSAACSKCFLRVVRLTGGLFEVI
eukprot:850102-Rhodomonas_salina.2